MAHLVPAARSARSEKTNTVVICSPNFLVRAAFAAMPSRQEQHHGRMTKGARAKMESVAKPVHLLGLTGGLPKSRRPWRSS